MKYLPVRQKLFNAGPDSRKSWIRLRIEIKIQQLQKLKVDPWRAVDANMGGVEGTKWRRRGSLDQWSY
jgi:hypothetical protein